MEINVNTYSNSHSFIISGVSYIGTPKSNTAMFVAKKVANLIFGLENVEECLVFAELGLEVPNNLLKKHCFVFSENPQFEYAQLTEKLYVEEEKKSLAAPYCSGRNGYIYSEHAIIGKNSVIAPGAIIGPNVIIGDNARISSGAVINNTVIGDNVIINEYAVIGGNGFTMAEDKDGNKTRIYSLGKVRIGNNVEVGAHANVSRGSGGDTIIDDNVKIDALVHIGHDVHLHKNVEITAGVVVGGFVEAYEGAYLGINAVIRNRVSLGKKCVIGMGSTVTKSVEPGVTVVGNPAKPFIK